MPGETHQQFVVSIMSHDRVGIVFEVSNAISSLGGNIADIRQSVLCGYFTMILLAAFPAEVTRRDIERKLAEIDARSETALFSAVKRVEEAAPVLHDVPQNAYVLTAAGPNRIGFVASVSSFCLVHNINILDLSTTTSGDRYVMVLLVDLSQCASLAAVRVDLQRFSQETGLQVVLQHYDIFKAVNEVNLPIS